MSVKTGHITLEKDSQMGVLHLVHSSPAGLPSNHPFAPCNAYLDYLAEGGKRGQRVNLERAARILVGEDQATIMDYDWRALRAPAVEHVRNRLLLQEYAASVINSTLSALKEVARRAWRLNQMSVQELEEIRDVKGVRGNHLVRPGRALSVSEISALFRICDRASATAAGARDAALLAILYGGGLRCCESIRLHLSDWTPRSHQLRVHGKGERDRTVHFLDGGARRCINLWLRLRGNEPGPLLCPVDRHGGIHTERGLSAAAIYKTLQRRGEEAGCAHFSAHDLRRSAATHLHKESKDIELVRDFLGHVYVQTTQGYIRSGGDAARKRAAKKMRVPFRPPSGKSKRRKRTKRGGGWKAQLRSRIN
jgi:site-specific recombinase XerD